MFTVYMDSQFNVWLMLGWQSSSIFSLISVGFAPGVLHTGTAECFLWKASDRNPVALQPSLLTQPRNQRQRGNNTTPFTHFGTGLNLKTVRMWQLKK